MRIFILVILLGFSVVSQAVYMDTKGAWYDALPNANGDLNGQGINIENTIYPSAAFIHWGNKSNVRDDSRYLFYHGRYEGSSVEDLMASESAFKIGKFIHKNKIIQGDSITEVKLKVDFASDLFDDFDYEFQFTHDETYNDKNKHPNNECPYGSNSHGCSDRVTLSSITQDRTIDYNGDQYQLNIFGFKEESGSVYTNIYHTQEDEDNETFIWAQFAKVNGPDPSVPEPTPLALMSLGLVGLLARKKFLQS
ncbi:MAG: PEP-CTERM sorting domain-containing protein [Gammaproteobacteria bacterium]|nr:PEP-CTERM sorting domain-containing protein [Gammaproteobacteria bacterium]